MTETNCIDQQVRIAQLEARIAQLEARLAAQEQRGMPLGPTRLPASPWAPSDWPSFPVTTCSEK